MKRISKEQAENIVLDLFSQISKLPQVKPEFATQSMQIMDNPYDFTTVTGVVLMKGNPNFFSDEDLEFKKNFINMLIFFIGFLDDEGVEEAKSLGMNQEFIDFLNNIKYNSTRLNFAIMQFIQAWKEYGRLETKYPNVMQFM